MATKMTKKELEKKLLEAGNKLLSPPSALPELISSLDRVQELLVSVQQLPSESMRESLSPLIKALITENLIRHSDVDVKVAVASCISEITRITAPDAPYDDDQMKEVFQLIVSSFENLDDTNSPSYRRRIATLEMMAKVKSCVVMLDLECDGLIIEMFQHFFRSIRDNRPENVLSSMETIMTVVLEESDEISLELLSTILDVLKKGNKDVLPTARQLGEKILYKCASKLKRFLLSALSSSGTSFDDYSKAVADVCQAGKETVEPCDGDIAKNLANESEAVNGLSEKPVEVAMETLDDAPPSDEVGPSTVGSSKSVMSNGTVKKEIEDTSVVNDNPKKSDHSIHGQEAEPSKTDVGAEKPTKPQKKRKKWKRRKPKSSKSPSEPVLFDSKTEAFKESDHEVKDAKAFGNKDPMADTAEPVAKEITSEVPVSSPKTSDNELVDAPSSPSKRLCNEARSKKLGRPKKKDDSMQDDGTTSDVNSKKESNTKKESDTKKASVEATVSESKSNNCTSIKPSSVYGEEESVPILASSKKKDAQYTRDLDAKSAKDSDKNVELGGGQREEKKQSFKVKTPVKDNAETPSKDEKKKSAALSKSTPKSAKEDSVVEKASKSHSKRKHSEELQVTNTKAYGPELIGSVIKVWWPADKKYYKGVVVSFYSDCNRHEVSYDDGDIEVLNLTAEKWHLVNAPLPAQRHTIDGKAADKSAHVMPKVKKAKTTSDGETKQGKTETSAKKSGASSSKSKATSISGSEQRDVGKSSEDASKNVGESGAKSEVSKLGNKLVDATPKSALNSKDDADTPNTIKSKQDTADGVAKSKDKSHESSGKINSSTSGKVDTSSSEKKETGDKQSSEQAEAPENSRGKSQSTSKRRKRPRKRKRNVKA